MVWGLTEYSGSVIAAEAIAPMMMSGSMKRKKPARMTAKNVMRNCFMVEVLIYFLVIDVFAAEGVGDGLSEVSFGAEEVVGVGGAWGVAGGVVGGVGSGGEGVGVEPGLSHHPFGEGFEEPREQELREPFEGEEDDEDCYECREEFLHGGLGVEYSLFDLLHEPEWC